MAAVVTGPNRGRGRGLAAITISLGAVLVACSLVVAQDVAQCKTDLDCMKYPGTRCENGGCVPRQGTPAATSFPPLVSCSSTQECLADRGANWFCRHPDNTCQSLVSQDCRSVLGDYRKDNSLVVGALLPLGGAQSSIGAALYEGLRFGVNDFARGLPPFADGVRRPVAVVVCNETEAAERAADHLLNTVKVPAILGGTLAATTARLVPVVTRTKVLLLSPTTTTPVTGDSDGLVWRAAPTDDFLSKAIAEVVRGVVEPRLRAAPFNIPKTRLVVLYKGDVYGKSLVSVLTQRLRINDLPATDPANSGYYSAIDYGDFDNPQGQDPLEKINSAIASALVPASLPNAVIIVGHAEGASTVLTRFEQNWPASASAPRPLHVLAPGLLVRELVDLMKGNDDVRRRVLAVAPGADPNTSVNLQKLLVRYRVLNNGALAETYGSASIYDSVYTLMYGLAGLGQTYPSGPAIADVLKKLSGPGKKLSVGTESISDAYAELGAGRMIDLDGASGPLDFDPASRDVKSDIHVWCGNRSGSNDVTIQDAGVYYTIAEELLGSLRSPCIQ